MESNPNDFDQLRRLLALKKHEQPPPGYFQYLSTQIVSRIEREEEMIHSSWWNWLVERFDARPVLAGAYACVISGLLMMGFKLSQAVDPETAAAGGSSTGGWLASTPEPVSMGAGQLLASPWAGSQGLVSFSSTEPVFDPSPLPFVRPAFAIQRASFQMVGH